jgi:excisionase family DNA binding protein
MLALLDQCEPFVADEAEAMIARTAVGKLRAVADMNHDIKISIEDDPRVVIPLPARAVSLIARLLESMSEQIPISIIPHEAELTTQQAADFLNVSRPFLIGLLESGRIPFRTVGTHRRIRFGDLVHFEQQSKESRMKSLEKLADEAARLGLE